MLGLEPYRADDDAWDAQAFHFLTTMLLARSVEVLLVAGLLILFAYVVVSIMLLVERVLTYLVNLYKTRAVGRSRGARVLQVTGVAFLLGWVIAIGLYNQESLSWIVLINILAFSFLLFSLTAVAVDVYEERKAAGNPIHIPTLDITQFLPWNSKQPNKTP